MKTNWMGFLTLGVLAVGTTAFAQVATAEKDKEKKPAPLKGLLITGGGYHDYKIQKDIITKGTSERANIEWDISFEPDRVLRTPKVYEKLDWAKGYDVIVHNECYARYKDPEQIAKIVASHTDHPVGVVAIHCAMHTFRATTSKEWDNLLGVESRRHGAHFPITVNVLNPKHPIMKGFPQGWLAPKGELYHTKILEGATALAEGYKDDEPSLKSQVCMWTNEYGKAKVFGLTIGHYNETMQKAEYLDVLTRGILWTCGKLGDDGEIAAGYAKEEEEESPFNVHVLPMMKTDRVCIIGDTFAERLQLTNYFETLLLSRFPYHDLSVRNLAWSGDTWSLRPRPKDAPSLDAQLSHHKADAIIACFGMAQSFDDSPEKFEKDLIAFLRTTLRRNYSGKSPPRILLVSPIAHEDTGDPNLPDGVEHNSRLEKYVEVLKRVALQANIGMVDLFGITKKLYEGNPGKRFTTNGIHLNSFGAKAVAFQLDGAVFGQHYGGLSGEQAKALKVAIAEKNRLHWQRYRALNAYYIYGGRADLKFADGNQTNRDVMAREMEILEKMIADRDAQIQALARGQEVLPPHDGDVPPMLPVETNYESEIKFLTPEEARESFEVLDGYEVNLFASEVEYPELENPVQLTFDLQGRLLVSTIGSYPHVLPGDRPNDKVLAFDDSDNDGRADKMTVFADGLYIPGGLEVGDGGVYVSAQPNLAYLQDSDGDGVADFRETVLHGFGTEDSHHSISAFTWGPGGGLYFQEGTFHHSQVETPWGVTRAVDGAIFRYDPTRASLDTFVSYGFHNPWGHCFDKWGQNFVADASDGANYFGAAFSGHLPYPEKHAKMKRFTPQESHARPTAGCEIVSSRAWPDSVQGNWLLNNCIGFQGIRMFELEEDGSGIKASGAVDLLKSRDVNFRPVDLQFGPDGALYVVDWHNPLVGHMQHSLRDPNRDARHGRIWRITHKKYKALEKPKIAGASIAELLDLLRAPEDRTRYYARIALRGQGTKDVLAAIEEWTAAHSSDHELLEALWVQQHHNSVQPKLLNRVLNAKDPRARAAATRVLRWWHDRIPDGIGLLKKAAADDHPRVRLEAVVAASYTGSRGGAEVLIEATNHPTDYYIDYAIKESLRALEEFRNEVLSGASESASAKLLIGVPLDELKGMERTPSVYEAMLARDDVGTTFQKEALAGLAKAKKTTQIKLLVATAMGSNVETLGSLLAEWPAAEARAVRPDLVELVRRAEGTDIRAGALAAIVNADGGTSEAMKLVHAGKRYRELAAAVRVAPSKEPYLEPLLSVAGNRGINSTTRKLATSAIRDIPGLDSEKFASLASIVADPTVGLQAAAVLAETNEGAWPVKGLAAFSENLAKGLGAVAAEDRGGADYESVQQFAKLILSKVGKSKGATLSKGLGAAAASKVQSVVVRSKPKTLFYADTKFTVNAGQMVKLTFENPDILPHNLLIVKPGSTARVGALADKIVTTGASSGYVPKSPDVLFHTKMVEAGKSDTITFKAPAEPGDYPYLCTFPGHWRLMKGVMRVEGKAKKTSRAMPRGYTIPTIDLDGQQARQVVVDREKGQYLGHPTTVLLEDDETMLCVYPKGHGRGGIVYKRSPDGGRTWTDRLPTPESWETSKEVPTLHRVVGADGKKRIIMWSGLYPARLSVSEDDGETWSPLSKVGDWGGIVVMGSVVALRTGAGHYMAMFHDDGRFFAEGGGRAKPVVFRVFTTFSKDGGLTWSHPNEIWSGSDLHLCEPGAIRSPNGAQLAVLFRENSRRRNSYAMFTDDEGATWTEPRELPAALTGDRHTGRYAPDGRLFISFRDTSHETPTPGDWVAWVGTYDDILNGTEGQYRVRLKDNTKGADCAYPGVEVLRDGTFVTTTYGHWEEGQAPYILSVRLRLEELDKMAKARGLAG